jgi:archaellum component FlaC
MGKKTDLENELAQMRADLEGADNDEIKAQLQEKISALETALESATDEEDLEEVADDLERLQSWVKNELGVPLAEVKAEMGEIKTLLAKMERKLKAAQAAPVETPPVETPPVETPPVETPSPPPPPPEKPDRGITRL